MAEHNLQALSGLLSIFGLNQPRPNPAFDPSVIDENPKLILGPDGEVKGVTQPSQVPRYKIPGLLGILAGNPAAQMNADRANKMQDLSAALYLNGVMADLNRKYRLGEITAQKAADIAKEEVKSVNAIKEEVARQRTAFLIANGVDPETASNDAIANNLLTMGQQATAARAAEAATTKLQAEARNKLFSNPAFSNKIAQAGATQPYNIAGNAINMATGESYIAPGLFPTTVETQGYDPKTKQFSKTTTNSFERVPGSAYLGNRPILSIGPESPMRAISKDGEVDTDASQAVSGSDNVFNKPSTLNSKKTWKQAKEEADAEALNVYPSQLPLGELDPFGFSQSYKGTPGRQWYHPALDNINKAMAGQALQRLQLR